jgi:uncharacterized membrane protein YjgN (DUF898 family)
MILGVICPKCGFTQLNAATCKKCGHLLQGPTFRPVTLPPPAIKKTPSFSGPEFSVPEGPLSFQEETGQSRALLFHGNGSSLFKIYLGNILLIIVTLGIYYYWAKVKARKYLLKQTEFEGDFFDYHGTGRELLNGYWKAGIFFGLPLTALDRLPMLLGGGPVLLIVCSVLTYILIFVLLPFGMARGRRYRLSRISWRGIRFSFRGEAWDFMKLFIGGSLLTAITLGLYYPFFAARKHGFMVDHTYFGNRRFEFDGHGRDLFPPYLRTWLLTLPTLGLSWIWFLAQKQRYFWEHTSSGSLQFRFTATGKALLGFYVKNLMLLIFTAGLAWPWIVVRKMHFFFRYLTLEGAIEPGSIHQEAQEATATGEALADTLDAGFELG